VNSNQPRHVVVVEKNPDGHRLHYVKLIFEEALKRNCSVTLVTSKSARVSAEWKLHLSKLEGLFNTFELHDFGVDSIQRTAIEVSADHVVVPDGDAFAYALATRNLWRAPASVTALAMRGSGQPSSIPGVSAIETLVKHALILVANYQPNVRIVVLRSSTWQGRSMVPVVRDPVTLNPRGEIGSCLDRATASESRRYWFGVVGVVGARKNLPLIAAALASLDRADIGLVVAGQLQPGVREEAEPAMSRLRRKGAEVVVMDRLLEDHEMDQLIGDVDCVVLAHSNEGPSGILGKAVSLGTRIVAAGARSLRRDCRNIRTGAVWTPLGVTHLSDALNRAIVMDRPEPKSVASPEDFAAALLA
jgi:hypothetical protein